VTIVRGSSTADEIRSMSGAPKAIDADDSQNILFYEASKMFSNCPRHALSTISCIANGKKPEKPLTESRMKEIAPSLLQIFHPNQSKNCSQRLSSDLLLVRVFKQHISWAPRLAAAEIDITLCGCSSASRKAFSENSFFPRTHRGMGKHGHVLRHRRVLHVRLERSLFRIKRADKCSLAELV
jgi:hypothetical protein